MPNSVPIIFARFTDAFEKVSWEWEFYNPFDIQAQLSALVVEAQSKGAMIAVNVALVYPMPPDEGQDQEEDKDNGKEE